MCIKKKFKPARENKFYEKYVKNKKARKVCFKKMWERVKKGLDEIWHLSDRQFPSC